MPVLEKFSLKGKKVLVTGGVAMYGQSVSEAVAEAGATTIIASRSEEKRQKVVDSLSKSGYEAHHLYLDLGKEETITKLHKDITEQFGALDVLINAAVLRPCESYNCTTDQWRESMEVNSTGLMNITRMFTQNMIERKQGNVVNISSMYGMVGPTFSLYEGMGPPMDDMAGDYWFHRAGIINYTRFLAAHLGKHNIRVNSISPGGFSSEVTKEPFLSRYRGATFLGRMADNEDVKGAVVFLASDASAYVTGVNLPLDAGFTAH